VNVVSAGSADDSPRREPSPLTVVVAPDSFKGSATAVDAAAAVAAGWLRVRPSDRLILKPMADGGEGTIDSFAAAFPGATVHPITVVGPDDRAVETSWLQVPSPHPGGTAVIELASTSGITLLDPLQPLNAHTFGFGQAIAEALAAGVSRLVLAIGGSASTDGGAGMLQALGARFVDAAGQPVRRGGGGLADIASIDISTLITPPAGGVVVLTDVTNPLLGARGAAAVYAPQKGADVATVVELENNLAHFSTVAAAAFTPDDNAASAVTPGTGAAGGTGYGLTLWGATLLSGATEIAELIDLAAAVSNADIVITGEGRFDAQSTQGKVPEIVVALAAASATDAYLVAGSIGAATEAFAATRSLTDLAGSSASARADAIRWLQLAGAELASEASASEASSAARNLPDAP
jgi:glycerate kinase